MAAEEEDDHARQAGLDQGIGEARDAREVLVLGGPPAQDEQHHHFVQDEGPDGGQRLPAGDAAAEHAQGEFREEVGGDQGGGEQGGQDDGQHPHALDLAAHDLAPQFIGVAVRGCFSHRRPQLASRRRLHNGGEGC